MFLFLLKIWAILRNRIVSEEDPFGMGALYFRKQKDNEDGFFGQDLIDCTEDKLILLMRKRSMRIGLLVDGPSFYGRGVLPLIPKRGRSRNE